LKSAVFLLLFALLVLSVSGCLKSPTEQVPVVKVDLTLKHNDDADSEKRVVVEKFEQTMTSVNFISRPQDQTSSAYFPGVQARVQLFRNVTVDGAVRKQVVFGPWASVPYKGDGEYSLVLGFKEGEYPQEGEQVHITVMIVDKDGKTIGYFINDSLWQSI
jgi:FtsP/CotA-like multicopper oxidase with cupredoxin domain